MFKTFPWLPDSPTLSSCSVRHPGFCSSVITDHKLLVHHKLDEGDPTSSVDELLWRIDYARPRAPFRMRPFPAGFRCADQHLVITLRNARKRAAEGDLILLCSSFPIPDDDVVDRLPSVGDLDDPPVSKVKRGRGWGRPTAPGAAQRQLDRRTARP